MAERLSTDELIALLNGRMADLAEDARVEALEKIADGYCVHCGSERKLDNNGRRRFCHCLNDE